MRHVKRALVVLVAALAVIGPGGTVANAQNGSGRTPPTQSKPCKAYFYVAGDGVRIRATPGGRKLGLAWYGESVRIGTVVNGWRQIWLPNRSGRPGTASAGWMSDRYIELVPCV